MSVRLFSLFRGSIYQQWGGIDDGSVFFGDAGFGGWDFGGPIGIGGFGTCGGNGGCALSVLHLGEAGVPPHFCQI